MIQVYVEECLLLGKSVDVPDVTVSAWRKRWEKEYGVTLKKPTRRYKIPAWLQGERCKIGWLNAARVRALCMCEFGYDPEFENVDQTPYHVNEAGSKEAGTMSVAGSDPVPLLENLAAARERYTVFLTTWRDNDRIHTEGSVYAEIMFKADAERVQQRLQNYIRSRGYGSWISVVTSPKGSYKEVGILNFLECHILAMCPGRRWRCFMSDVFAPHKADVVCGQRVTRR